MEEHEDIEREIQELEQQLEAPKKPRKKVDYVQTDARREAFEKARQKREENLLKKKEMQEKLQTLKAKKQQQTVKPKLKKHYSDDDEPAPRPKYKKYQTQDYEEEPEPRPKYKKYQTQDYEEEEPTESEEEPIIPKKAVKPKKAPRIVYEESESEEASSESDDSVEYTIKKTKKKKNPPAKASPSNTNSRHIMWHLFKDIKNLCL
jgi:hypothetical protein